MQNKVKKLHVTMTITHNNSQRSNSFLNLFTWQVQSAVAKSCSCYSWNPLQFKTYQLFTSRSLLSMDIDIPPPHIFHEFIVYTYPLDIMVLVSSLIIRSTLHPNKANSQLFWPPPSFPSLILTPAFSFIHLFTIHSIPHCTCWEGIVNCMTSLTPCMQTKTATEFPF